ncbi:hypothetical protein F4680DRAFT_446687 [Xylaria scruposa]|nr:hypothetical protein F4680DRAFT_446687 [Xylaria scruposa]
MDLSDFNAVTWATIVKSWAMAGAPSVALTDRKTNVLIDVANEIKDEQSSSKDFAHPADLRSEDSAKKLWDKAKTMIGRIDILVNDAGTMSYTLAGSIEMSMWWNDSASHEFLTRA